MAKRPITQHPLFPAIVALWFGALFGLGSLAIRASLIESLILKSRLDLIVPAAAPPLGMTARILLALGMAVFGAVIGTIVGRIIARPRHVVTERSRKFGSKRTAERVDATADQSAYSDDYDDYDGDDRPDEAPAQHNAFAANRRRALTLDDNGSEDRYHREFAPLPGGAPQILDVTEFDFTGEPAPVPDQAQPAPADDPQPQPAPPALDLTGYLKHEAEDAPQARQVFNPGPAAFAPPPDAEPAPAPATTMAAPGTASTPDVAPDPVRPVADTHLDLVKRLADSMSRRRAAIAAAASAPPPLPKFDAPAAPEPEVAPEPAGPPQIIAPPVSLPAALRPLSLDDDGDGDDDEALSAVLPARHIPFGAPASGDERADPPAGEPEPDLEDGYSSLLDLSAPSALRHAPVRIEEDEPESDGFEPAVRFPGEDAGEPADPFAALRKEFPFAPPPPSAEPTDPAPIPAPTAIGGNLRRFDAPAGAAEQGAPVSASTTTLDAEETERALRTALATLQRMSARG